MYGLVRFSSSSILSTILPFLNLRKGALDGFLSAARAASYTLGSLYYYRTEFSVRFRCQGTSSLDDDYLYDYLFECTDGRRALMGALDVTWSAASILYC